MLRTVTLDDREAILGLVETAGLLGSAELSKMAAMFGLQFGASGPARAALWAVDDDDGVAAVAYAEPEAMTDGTWNLRLIAVHPDRQRRGRGRALLTYVEQALADRGGRLLLVDTSGQAVFEGARALYRSAGFEQEARIRDFFEPGDDKIVFTKRLGGRGTRPTGAST